MPVEIRYLGFRGSGLGFGGGGFRVTVYGLVKAHCNCSVRWNCTIYYVKIGSPYLCTCSSSNM